MPLHGRHVLVSSGRLVSSGSLGSSGSSVASGSLVSSGNRFRGNLNSYGSRFDCGSLRGYLNAL